MATNDNVVHLVEVGPRDGLQNETQVLPVAARVALIEALVAAGLSTVEVGSFVRADRVPAMADSDAVFRALNKNTAHFPVLIPNLKGMELAVSLGVQQVSCFTSVSDSFNQKNIQCSTDESLQRIGALAALCRQHAIPLRAYLSCVVACPYEGKTAPARVAAMVESLLDLGCETISLGDTIGVGTPKNIRQIVQATVQVCPVEKIALHLHDTYGQALANCYTGLNLGVRTFDSSVAGLGGCPYARGASGNLASEDLVYLLHGEGMHTGVDLMALARVGRDISQQLGRVNQSKVGRALLAQQTEG